MLGNVRDKGQCYQDIKEAGVQGMPGPSLEKWTSTTLTDVTIENGTASGKIGGETIEFSRIGNGWLINLEGVVTEGRASAQEAFEFEIPDADAEKFAATAKSIACVNNLKEVGNRVRQWAMDHSDKYPCNVPTAEGGTLELCQMTEDGFDANSFRHLQVLSNELNTPKVLVCPADTSKKEALRFETLDSSNISYLIRSGPQVSEDNPEEVIARCPIHGHTLHCDGSVAPGD